MATLLVVAWVFNGREEVGKITADSAAVRNWAAIGEWARSHTNIDAQFLLPTKDTKPTAPKPHLFLGDTAVFEYASHRRVWVDYSRGAAAMWSPSYYTEWNERIWPVLALNGFADRLSYAQKNKISYFVTTCDSAPGEAYAFKVDDLCVYDSGVGKQAKSELAK
jgi:hypothetical protein